MQEFRKVKYDTSTGFALGVYFLSFNCITMLDLPKTGSYLWVTAFGCSTVIFGIIHNGFDFSRTTFVRWMMLSIAFVSIVGGSYAANRTSYESTIAVKAIGYVSLYVIASTLSSAQRLDFLRPCLVTSWIGLLLLTVFIVAMNHRSPNNNRLIGPFDNLAVKSSGLHANGVGQIAMTAMALAPVLGWRAVLLTLPIATYAAYLASSRGSLIGILVAFLTFILAREMLPGTTSSGNAHISRRAAFIVFALMAGAVLAIPSWSIISEEVFMLTDASRGVGSGFTGRTDVWANLLERWKERPLLGNGYGILKDESLSASMASDGGYIMVLAELGVFGLMFFAVLFSVALWVSTKAAVLERSGSSIAMLVFTVTFAFINVFESRIVGTGSIGLGVFFLISSVCIVHADAVVDRRNPVRFYVDKTA